MRFRAALVGALIVGGGLVGTAPMPSQAGVYPGCAPTGSGYRCTYGPIPVTAGRSTTNTQGVPAPKEAGYVTWARASLVDEDGARVPKHAVHLHHAVWLNLLNEDMTCAGWPERFFATGKERTKIVLPPGYGYHWATGAVWGMNYHLDSHHVTGDVYLRLDMGFVPDAEATEMAEITPVWLDVANCSFDSEFNVRRDPSKGNYKRSWTFVMPEGGRFVTLAGHLHDGGIRLGLKNVTTGHHMFTSRAVYEHRWNLKAMTTYSNAAGKPVAAGDQLELTAVYNDERAWRDVMGIMMGALVPAD